MTICPECYAGFHSHCIGQGCCCDCQIEPDEHNISEELQIIDDEGEWKER